MFLNSLIFVCTKPKNQSEMLIQKIVRIAMDI